MAFSEQLDERISEHLLPWNMTRKTMFGGACYLLNGNMVCGVYKDFLIVRLGKTAAEAALRRPETRPFDITGRPMAGWVMIAEGDVQGDRLGEWIEQAVAFAESLPPK